MKSSLMSLKIFLLGFCIILFSFTNKNKNYQTECVSIQNDGYVTIKIWDIKLGPKYLPEQAMKDAIHAILFSGIASNNECIGQAPLLTQTEQQEKFKDIEKSFFSKNGKWSLFTRSSATETTLPKNLGVNNWKVYQLSISKNELRKFLEEQKIIKLLNTGF